jgi:ATP-dependent RNA helicase RhlE
MAFKKMNLIEPLLRALASEKYTVPTPIQEKTIPLLLEGKDVVGIAQTGTGKTAAFVFPILQKITLDKKIAKPGHPRALVLAPTRELAAQIAKSFSTYGKFLNFKQLVIFGGVSQVPQVNALHRSLDVLVATPGRLLDLMNQRYIYLDSVEFFVLDEADRMLDMGFIHDVKKIASKLPPTRQSLFFSATMPPAVAELARSFLKNPARVEVTPQASTVETVEQNIFFVDQKNKNELLLDLLKQENLKRVLVFTSMKHRADDIAKVLNRNGIRAEAIHGNKSQNQRTIALERFKSGASKVMVATDIAARGIDIENISHVINYDLPNEPETYVHRIGRTARAGASGAAYSFCCGNERDFLRDIERLIKQEIKESRHAYHSESAKNATGVAARPLPRQGGRRFGGDRGRFGGGRFGEEGRSRGRFGGGRDRGRGGFGRRDGGRGGFGGERDRNGGRNRFEEGLDRNRGRGESRDDDNRSHQTGRSNRRRPSRGFSFRRRF